MNKGFYIITIGYAPAPMVGEPNPTEPDGKARLFVQTQGPEADDQAKVETDVRAEFAKAKPDQHIVDLKVNKVDEATYQTQRIMNLSKGKKRL